MQKELLRLSGQALLLVGGIGLPAAWPSYHWGGSENLQAMLAAGVVTLLASIVSLIPITIAAERKADWLGQACLGSTVIRLMVTLAAGMGWFLVAKPPLLAFALWTMLFYLVLLVWETRIAMKFIKNIYGADGKKLVEDKS